MLEVLHDHYKDSFTHIRDKERQRDRLFLVLIALMGFLIILIQYPDSIRVIFRNISAAGTKLNLAELPLPALLSATWTFLLVLTLRYCQSAILVERKYSYLHNLELKISWALQDPDLYRREGKAYLDNYPAFSKWTWCFYSYVVPAIVITATSLLIHRELVSTKLQVPNYHGYYDAITAGGTILSVVLYRVWPLISMVIHRICSLLRSTKKRSAEVK